jgi:hypothetical protein
MSGISGAPGVYQPADRAPHSEWMRFAVAQGMPENQARGMTRDQLRACLTSPAEPLTGEPHVERLDEDPEARAALREARAKPWGRS